MQRESGLDNFYSIVQQIYQEWRFKDKSRLFEVAGCTKLIFTNWQIADENNNAAQWHQREQDIRAATRMLNQKRKRKTKRTKAGVRA